MIYTIRPMEPADIPAVTAIDQLSFPSPWPAPAFMYELRQKHSHYYTLLKPVSDELLPSGRKWPRWRARLPHLLNSLFRSQSWVIGYVGFRLRGSEAHITTIAVHPDRRREGLGELLLLTALEKMLKQQISLVTLEMRPSNQVARHLYRKYGFQMQSTHRGYYRDGEDAWLMTAEVGSDAYKAQLAGLRQVLEARLRQQQIHVRQNGMDAL